MKYYANNRGSVSRLAMNLSTTPLDQAPPVLAAIYSQGLMRPEWQLRLMAWFGMRMRRMTPFQAYLVIFHTFLQKDREVVREALTGVVRHCLRGTDLEDEDSVGGWSQREIDLLTSKVTFSNDADVELDDLATVLGRLEGVVPTPKQVI
jgi:hypothetical protein